MHGYITSRNAQILSLYMHIMRSMTDTSYICWLCFCFFLNTVQDSHNKDNFPSINSNEYIGVSTGNWGCGAFGGNPEIKSMIQWIAASQVRDKLNIMSTFVSIRMHAADGCIAIKQICMPLFFWE